MGGSYPNNPVADFMSKASWEGAVTKAGLNSNVLKALGTTFGPMAGYSGGMQGTGVEGPQPAQITPGVSTNQLGNAYSGAQNGLAAQQALLSALQSQTGLQGQDYGIAQQNALLGGLQGQNYVGQQANAIGMQQNLANQLGQYNGAQNLNSALQAQQGVYGQQQALANQYGDVAAGRGPNPALAMLNQQTGQNVSNQAALMAGQRGAGSNVGLLARQAAQQGAATQQQAVGQGSVMQSQQALNAMAQQGAQQQAMAQTQNNIANIANNQVGLTGQQNAALIAAAQAGVGQTQQQQQAYNAQANALANQQIGATTQLSQGQQSEQQIMQNALAAQNQANVASQGNINNSNTATLQTNLQGRQGFSGGLMSGAGAAIAALAKGGEVRHMADGGTMAPPPASAPVATPADPAAPASSFGAYVNRWAKNFSGQDENKDKDKDKPDPFGGMAQTQGAKGMLNGSKDLVSSIAAFADGKKSFSSGGLAEKGGKVAAKAPAQKAVKKGDSYSNDKIPAMLSEHEIVLPREVTMGKDPVRSAADFVSKVIAKRRSA